MITCILFDLDDTLHDKRASLAKCGRRLFKTHELNRYASENDFLQRFVDENCIIQPKEQVFAILAAAFGIEQAGAQQLKAEFDHTFH
ncbi:MAG: hypothetical protein KDE47_11805, partial [Caldilineaceae bacterium]|nr:hypothetical protein [Caldilineaceae bacterium]